MQESSFWDSNSYTDPSMVHRDTAEEIAFFQNVVNGNTDAIHKNCMEHRFMDGSGVGQLSVDPLVNIKYHMVVTAAIITRRCIERGLEPERAFRMSDFYIRKLDYAETPLQVEEIHNNMVLDFTGKMRLISRNKGLSRPVSKCVEYIYSHVTERITVPSLADYTGVSVSYLSRQFVKELGVPVSDYIREKKIEQAQELLKNSDQSILEIACTLSFSSQSHFIQTFKHIVGVTPKKYRSQNGYSSWK